MKWAKKFKKEVLLVFACTGSWPDGVRNEDNIMQLWMHLYKSIYCRWMFLMHIPPTVDDVGSPRRLPVWTKVISSSKGWQCTTRRSCCHPSYNFSYVSLSQQLNALRHTRNQCDRDPHYSQNNCYVNCFMASLVKENLTCRLPYMTGKFSFGSSNNPSRHFKTLAFKFRTVTVLPWLQKEKANLN